MSTPCRRLKIGERERANIVVQLAAIFQIYRDIGRYHNVGRRYIGMARMHASRNTFSKPPNSQTKKL